MRWGVDKEKVELKERREQERKKEIAEEKGRRDKDEEKEREKRTRRDAEAIIMQKILTIEMPSDFSVPLAPLHPNVVGNVPLGTLKDPCGYSNKIYLDLLKTLHNGYSATIETSGSASPDRFDRIHQQELYLGTWVLTLPRRQDLEAFRNYITKDLDF